MFTFQATKFLSSKYEDKINQHRINTYYFRYIFLWSFNNDNNFFAKFFFSYVVHFGILFIILFCFILSCHIYKTL